MLAIRQLYWFYRFEKWVRESSDDFTYHYKFPNDPYPIKRWCDK